jgi:hypothetical protein
MVKNKISMFLFFIAVFQNGVSFQEKPEAVMTASGLRNL